MRWSWRSFSLFGFAAVVGAATVLIAQNASDLPAAPSEVARPKPVPQKPAPTAEQQTQVKDPPAQDSNEKTPAPPAVDGAKRAQPAAPDQSEDESNITIPVVVNEVNVVFTVTDRHNRYVKDLNREELKVIDDERPVPEFRFRRETNLPLQVGLLIDASNSIRDRFKFEQESAIEFLNETIRPHSDKAFVLGFDVTPEVTQDFTDNTENLAKGIRMLRPGGGTALFDALFYACRDKLMNSSQTSSVRRAVILVSDGNDNQSHVTREEAIDMALRANVIVYTISTNFAAGGESEKGDKIMERIADATGGRTFRPFQLDDVANAFAQIQDDLRSQYELSYRPKNFAHDGRFRTIEISALRKGLKVRSRNGYYAPTE
jgi:VWFA-related protein